jgi:hypothetical protein
MIDAETQARHAQWKVEDYKRAEEYAKKGSVQHFMLREGFMPHNEEDAEAIARGVFRECENLRFENDRLLNEVRFLREQATTKKVEELEEANRKLASQLRLM